MTNPTIQFAARSLPLSGPARAVGQPAPDFEGVGADLAPVRFSALRAQHPDAVFILSSVPSLDTGVCSAQTHRFEAEVSHLAGKAQLLTLSMDLPFAQGRFCGGEPKPNTRFLSDHRLASFGQAYATLIPELRLLARAVFVVGRDGKLAHVQYVQDTGTHPDYGAVLAAVRAALGPSV